MKIIKCLGIQSKMNDIGIESFWVYAKTRLVRFRSMDKKNFSFAFKRVRI